MRHVQVASEGGALVARSGGPGRPVRTGVASRARSVLAAGVLGAVAVLGTALPAAAASVSYPQYGLSFSLPKGWTSIPLKAKDIGALLTQAAKADPALKGALSQQVSAASKKGLKVFAVGPLTGGFFPNFSIAMVYDPSLPTGSSFTSLMKMEVELELTKAGASAVTASAGVTPLGRAVEVGYVLHLQASAGRQPGVDGYQLYVEHGPRLYILTFTASSAAMDHATAAVVERTWKWA